MPSTLMLKIPPILQKENDWCLQRHIWQTELYLTKNSYVKVIKTLIMSSNQVGIKLSLVYGKHHKCQKKTNHESAKC